MLLAASITSRPEMSRGVRVRTSCEGSRPSSPAPAGGEGRDGFGAIDGPWSLVASRPRRDNTTMENQCLRISGRRIVRLPEQPTRSGLGGVS